MNVFALTSILIFFTTIAIAIFVLWKGKNQKINYILIVFSLIAALWGFAGYRFSTADSKDVAFFWWQIAYIAVIGAPMLYCHLILTFLKLNRRRFLFIAYLLATTFILINLLSRKLFLGDLRFVFNEFYCVDWLKNKNSIYALFFIWYWILVGYAHFVLVRAYFRSYGLERTQLKYFILGPALGWFGTIAIYLPIFRIDIYPVLNVLIAVYPISWAYGILRHQLLEIEVIIRRAVVFAGVFGFVFSVFVLTTIFGQRLISQAFGITNPWLMATLAVLIITLSYGGLRNFLIGITDRFLFQKKYDYQKILKEASVGMAQITDLRKLLSLIVHVVSSKLRTNQTSILLFDQDTNTYKLALSRGQNKLAGTLALEANNPLLRHLCEKREPLSLDDVQYKLQDQRILTRNPQLKEQLELIKTKFQELKAQLCIPAFIKERLSGVLVLGEKLSRDLYSSTDLTLLSTLANQAALAIENAQFFEQVKETQLQLFQAEKMATIGTMADGLSHQINNRLNALGLIAGDTLDTFKLTDTEKYPPEVRDLLNQSKHALERISANVKQGGEIVHGLLKYSRQGEAGFDKIALDKILDAALDMAKYKVKIEEFDLLRDYPCDTPLIRANLTQLQEVFFNFIDNSYDAIMERKDILKEQGFRGQIKISAESQNSFLKIQVSDNGIGVTQKDFTKLFTPFFTTKISSRKGTGLGLYVIHKIITQNHNGRISVSSKYKEGTTFIIELPLAK